MDSGDGRERLPRSKIPEDLTCILCDQPVTFRNAAGYQGHMAAVHSVYFEMAERDGVSAALQRHIQERPVPEDPAELPVWAKVAIVKHELYGESWPAIAEGMGKAADTLRMYSKTPAGQRALDEVRELSTVKNITKWLLDSATAGMYADWLAAFEWAKERRDYKMVHTMVKDIGLQPILQEAQKPTMPTTLVLNLGSASLDPIERQHTHVVEATVVDDTGEDGAR